MKKNSTTTTFLNSLKTEVIHYHNLPPNLFVCFFLTILHTTDWTFFLSLFNFNFVTGFLYLFFVTVFHECLISTHAFLPSSSTLPCVQFTCDGIENIYASACQNHTIVFFSFSFSDLFDTREDLCQASFTLYRSWL